MDEQEPKNITTEEIVEEVTETTTDTETGEKTEKTNINVSVTENININEQTQYESFFDGGLFQWIGWKILGFIVTALTFGICFPWAVCMLVRWETKHTVINGRRLAFDGKAVQLLGNWIKWIFLTIITLGIYGFWVKIKMKKWITKHTHFACAPAQN